MTDKERYEAAMEENHRLREELNEWKKAYDFFAKENYELKKVNKNLETRMLKMEAVIQLQIEQNKGTDLEA